MAAAKSRTFQVKEMTDRSALLSGLAVRYTKTGEELERLGATTHSARRATTGKSSRW